MSKLSLISLADALCPAAPPSTMAGDDHRIEEVQFVQGTSSKSLMGSITGGQDLTYIGAAG